MRSELNSQPQKVERDTERYAKKKKRNKKEIATQFEAKQNKMCR